MAHIGSRLFDQTLLGNMFISFWKKNLQQNIYHPCKGGDVQPYKFQAKIQLNL
jgi:hypothetical protein